jgi:hypothetical protein
MLIMLIATASGPDDELNLGDRGRTRTREEFMLGFVGAVGAVTGGAPSLPPRP